MPTITESSIQNHAVVSHEEWLSARKAFLAKEKEFTRLRDDLSRQRRELPWEKVEKQYVFDGLKGKESLPDLFENRSQLLVHHFMFNPAWDEGCKHCSFWADNWNGSTVHLNHRDVTFVAISRAPLARAILITTISLPLPQRTSGIARAFITIRKRTHGWKIMWDSACSTRTRAAKFFIPTLAIPAVLTC